ncbi:hypothetical protein [Bernardetia sp. MNP-M8]|uniref:hypothetical protein n=1 Tax=Bernardetia sp. MNP-M8 TaxID=3127470 RepID=UPI0030D2AE97
MKITKLLSLLLLCLVFLSNGCNEDDENENLEIEEGCDAPKCYVTRSKKVYEGGTESVTLWKYKIVNGKKLLDKLVREQNEESFSVFQYDVNNNYIGNKLYNGIRLEAESKITYNNIQKIETLKQLYYENSNSLESTSEYKFVFEYDSEGKLKAMEVYEDGEYTQKSIVQKYNSAGEGTLTYQYDKDNNLVDSSLVEYNNCNAIRNQQYVSDNIRQTTGLEFYFPSCESSCLASKQISFNEQGESAPVFLYEYDEKGLLDSRTTKSERGETKYVTYFEYECD